MVIPTTDPTCGDFLLNLFGPKVLQAAATMAASPNFTPIVRKLHQFLGEAEVFCDPTIETCGSAYKMQPYEEYEEYNRFIG